VVRDKEVAFARLRDSGVGRRWDARRLDASAISALQWEACSSLRLTVGIAIAVLLISLLALLRARRMDRASHERDGLSRFRDSFHGRYPEILLSQTYGYLAERHGVVGPHYIVNPTDDLVREFGLAGLDLEDAVLVIADRAGARLPRATELDELKSRGVRTVDDLLRFLEPFFRPEAVKG